MAGFKRGSQAWYDEARQELVNVSKKLREKEISESTRRSLFDRQLKLIDELDIYWNENLINTPLDLN